MLQYINGFSCILNQKQNSVVLSLCQDEPVPTYKKQGEILDQKINDVASLVMDVECAKALGGSLLQLFADIPKDNK